MHVVQIVCVHISRCVVDRARTVGSSEYTATGDRVKCEFHRNNYSALAAIGSEAPPPQSIGAVKSTMPLEISSAAKKRKNLFEVLFVTNEKT